MPWLPKNSIVVPVDFSDASWEAVILAMEMVDQPEQVHVIHALEQSLPLDPAVVWDAITDQSRIQSTTEALQAKLTGIGAAGVDVSVRIGSAGFEIVDFAEDADAQLIIIPSHGRTNLRHLLLGSIAERVARHASCPVLIIRRSDCEEHEKKRTSAERGS